MEIETISETVKDVDPEVESIKSKQKSSTSRLPW